MFATWITILITMLILASASIKLVRDKKKGVKCMGCPAANACTTKEQIACSHSTSHDDLALINLLDE